MIRIKRNILLDFDLVNALEDGQSMADARNAHVLQILVLHFYECFPIDRLAWSVTSARVVRYIVSESFSPIIASAYCPMLKLLM